MAHRRSDGDIRRVFGRRPVVWTVFLTMAFELVTCLFRFGFGWESSRHTGFVSRFTGGIRIHHGYIGLALIVVAVLMPLRKERASVILLISGMALLFSDLIHHVLVLWPITGSPQFDLLYP